VNWKPYSTSCARGAAVSRVAGEHGPGRGGDAETGGGGTVLGELTRANQREVAQARLILETTHDKEVGRFAGRMANDHAMALKQEKSIIHRLAFGDLLDAKGMAVAPADSDRTMRYQNDPQYIDQQVEAQQNLLNRLKLDDPRITDPGLRTHVRAIEKTVDSHLSMATRLQSQLSTTTMR
jgi:predicted outer membrane protein